VIGYYVLSSARRLMTDIREIILGIITVSARWDSADLPVR